MAPLLVSGVVDVDAGVAVPDIAVVVDVAVGVVAPVLDLRSVSAVSECPPVPPVSVWAPQGCPTGKGCYNACRICFTTGWECYVGCSLCYL